MLYSQSPSSPLPSHLHLSRLILCSPTSATSISVTRSSTSLSFPSSDPQSSSVFTDPQLSNKLSLKSNEQQHSDEEAHLVGEEGPFLSEASSPLPSPTGGPAKRLLPCRGSSQPSLSKSFVTRSTTSLEEQDRSVRMPKEETGVEEQDRRSLLNDELDQIHESVGSLPMSSMLPMLLMSPMPEGIRFDLESLVDREWGFWRYADDDETARKRWTDDENKRCERLFGVGGDN
ncbi:hypothetical protein LINPERHAP2_LOCUS6308 [Linum perenne]